ncbi:MAG: sulfatase [Thermoanaerobaculia bacterium]
MRRALGPLCFLLVLACTREAVAPRNLLLITLDTLRADHLGAYGYDRPTSPELDAFAARSTLFTDALCNVPTTLPSHVSFLTGLPPLRHGARRNGVVPDESLETLFDLFGKKGVRTAAIVATGVLGPDFTEVLGPGEVILPPRRKHRYDVPAERVTDEARRWLDAHDSEPFALWVHYYDAHEPYDEPRAYRERFARPYEGALPETLDLDTLAAFNDDPDLVLDDADRRHVVDLYDAGVAYLDERLGWLLDDVEQRGLLDTTAVVVVGDHGQALGESDFWGHGLRLLEGVVRIPFLVRLPGQHEGRRVDDPVDSLDLLPTVAELFDLTPTGELPGRSLVPALYGRRPETKGVRMVERRQFEEAPDAVAVALYGEGWKLLWDQDPDGPLVTRFSRDPDAFDVDRGERPNADQRRLLDEAIRLVRTGASSPDDLDPETRRMLEDLGYL